MKKEENFIRALSDVDDTIIAEAAAARLAPKKNNRLIVLSIAACLALMVGMTLVLLMGSRETSVPAVPLTSTTSSNSIPNIQTTPIQTTPSKTITSTAKPTPNTTPITTKGNPYKELISVLKKAPSGASSVTPPPSWENYIDIPYDVLNPNQNKSVEIVSESYTTADGEKIFSFESVTIPDYSSFNPHTQYYTRITCESKGKTRTYTVRGRSGGSAIVTEDAILVITNYWFGSKTEWERPYTYLPTLDKGKGPEILPIKDIFFRNGFNNRCDFTTVLTIDIDTFDIIDIKAWYSLPDGMYITENNLYFYTFNFSIVGSSTKIIGISYKDNRLSPIGSIRLEGTVEIGYCLDEEDGILRVVTNKSPGHRLSPPLVYSPDGTSKPLEEPDNVLYCLSAKDLSVVAKVENFYEFENEYPFLNVGFDGDHVYVCPKADLVSPVIHFDLSDLNNITYETVEYPLAYSRYLKEIGDGLYFTVRSIDANTKLVEVVRLEESGFVAVAEYAKEVYPTGYDFDVENKIIRLLDWKSRPIITLQFDGENLKAITE
ncbi:MAG: beta-propeller domain-containing protein [Clostridia bacterium]|nr:beta-propeller domain-containing protein [Clostridia bacterium]